MTPTRRKPERQRAFSLLELAIVLLIVGLLGGGLLGAFVGQQESLRKEKVKRRLETVQEALFGFAQANGRLPCPATPDSLGLESFCVNGSGDCGGATTTPPAHGRCQSPLAGFVPAATLALTPQDGTSRLLVDEWGQALRYAVADYERGGAFPFTQSDGVRNVSPAVLESAAQPALQICASAAAASNAGTATAACGSGQALSGHALAVVYSTGPNGARGGTGTDERHNPNPNTTLAADRLFIDREATGPGASGGEFDDLLLVVSPYLFYARLLAAGRL